jgi:hypothetical protein
MAMNNDLFAKEEAIPQHPGLPLFVVFTTVQRTLLSLHAVDQLSNELATRIILLVPDRAEYSKLLITPVMLADFTARYFLTMIPHTGDLQIKLIRYPAATEDFWEVLPPRSLIALAGDIHRFWPSAEQRFAQKLRQAGHEVIFFLAESLVPEPHVNSEAGIKPGKKKSSFECLRTFFMPSRTPQSRS